ncbi:MAG: CYTH domain-containing protein [Lachnospiraceae bacterium]|nr:CYTH domain-containing protein [Lachnospiraceae bacterium]
MEIERKFLVNLRDIDLNKYKRHEIMQGYICKDPVIRVRLEDDNMYLTVKGKGLLTREELNLPLSKEAFDDLIKKTDGKYIRKTRYLIPYNTHTIELDVFHEKLEGLMVAEVEFETVEDANAFIAPEWFIEDVTDDVQYQNVNLIERKGI